MAYDELLRLTGTTNNPLETVTATANGTAIYVGAGKTFFAERRIGGAVTGTTPTLDLKVQEASTPGGTFTDLAPFPTATATDAGETGSRAVVRGFSTTKDYVRVVKTVGGTSPSFGGVSVLLQPVGVAVPA